jgi:orotate phosphoribosyltransferase
MQRWEYKRQQRNQLRDIIAQKSLIKNQEFKLSSGAASNYFFNMKMTMLDPLGTRGF